MRVSTLVVEAVSILLLFSPVATVVAAKGHSVVIAQHQESFQAVGGQKRVHQRSPQGADQGGNKVYQPYDYGYGAFPDDEDVTASENADTAATSSVGYSNTSSTDIEPSTGSGETSMLSALETSESNSGSAVTEGSQSGQEGYPTGPAEGVESTSTESASSNMNSESQTDDIYLPDQSTDSMSEAQTTTPEDGYPPQEPSNNGAHHTTPGDETASLADISDGPAQSTSSDDSRSSEHTSSFWNSTASSESRDTASLRTLRPPYTNTTSLGATVPESTIQETIITSTRILGTPGDLEPPVLTSTGFPTWTIAPSRSQGSPSSPYPSNATTFSSISGTGSVAQVSSGSTSLTSSLAHNVTTSAAQTFATSSPLNATAASDLTHTGTGMISPTVRRTSQSDIFSTGYTSSVVVPTSTERPPFPTANATTHGIPSEQSIIVTISISPNNVTVSPISSTSLNTTGSEWTTRFNTSLSLSTVDSGSILPASSLPPFPTGNTSLTTGPTGVPTLNTSAVDTESHSQTSSHEDDPTMFPGGWSESLSETPTQISSPPFPTHNTTSGSISPGGVNSTTSGYISEAGPSTSETRSILSISGNITARPSLTPSSPFPSLNITHSPPSVVSEEATLSRAVNETGVVTSISMSSTLSPTPVPWPVPLPSNQTSAPFPNATTSGASISLSTGAWTSLSGDVSSVSTITTVPSPSVDLPPPPFPLPNSTVILPSGTASSVRHSTISGTLGITATQSIPYPNTTSVQTSDSGLPPPLPPFTLDNTTITFSPVTDDPIPPTSALPPFPLPNVTVSSGVLGTETPPLPNSTILPGPSSSIIDGSLSVTTASWPNSILTSIQTVSVNMTDLTTSRPSFPTGTVIPWPANTTSSANSTEPDHTGTLFDWPAESDEPSHNNTTTSVNVTASPTWSVSATQPPFPLSNSTLVPGPTGLPPIPIPGVNTTAEATRTDSLIATVSGTLIFSHTVAQESSETTPQFSSIWANVTSTASGTLIISQTVIEEPTESAHFNSTKWQQFDESTRSVLPPPEVTPFPNTTSAANSTSKSSGTLTITLTPTITIVMTKTSTELLDPSTTTRTITSTSTNTSTSTIDVTITRGSVESSPPCITITVTHGNVTEKITKTITEPHPDLTESASLAWDGESTSVALPVSGEMTASVTESQVVTTACTSTTKPPKTKTTSCTSSLCWINDTMTTFSISTVTTSEPYGDLSLSPASVTSAVSTYSELSSLYPSSISASNITFIPVPDPSTMLTSTRRVPVVEPFVRMPTTTASDEPLPSSPDYPWGGEGPLHRHHNVSTLGSSSIGAREASERGWWSQLKQYLGRIRARWFDGEEILGYSGFDDEDEDDGQVDWDPSDEYDLVDGKK